MSRIVIQALALMGVYLLVMTSAEPADAVTGLLLGLVLAVALRPRLPGRSPATPRVTGLLALGPVLVQTVAEMVIGSWRTALFCLRGTGQPGFVEIPRGERSRHGVALWGVLTGEAPDEVPEIVVDIAAGWATLLLFGGGLLLLRAPDTLHRVLALDVIVAIVIILLTILSYLRDVSYYIDAALALALLALTSTLVAARYVTRGGPFS